MKPQHTKAWIPRPSWADSSSQLRSLRPWCCQACHRWPRGSDRRCLRQGSSSSHAPVPSRRTPQTRSSLSIARLQLRTAQPFNFKVAAKPQIIPVSEAVASASPCAGVLLDVYPRLPNELSQTARPSSPHGYHYAVNGRCIVVPYIAFPNLFISFFFRLDLCECEQYYYKHY
ncbi:hypothetical protein FB45DRAFT_942636 [Roridomyces roridus]|uniref:Uncharacterized protein n=1 Tax=Roridomyces roridus TaxID=1738132 RepID=A0AAD7B4U6_9AGAR|nr:hypothetical protein FB45DRAFT_942636 [Roridomyces roridus]